MIKNKDMMLLKRITDKVDIMGNKVLQPKEITFSQGAVLIYLRFKDDNSAPIKEIEKYLEVSQATAQGLISRLQKKGFIELNSSAEDKRIKIVSLTEKGIETNKEVGEKMSEIENFIFSDFDQSEKEIFNKLLMKIYNKL